MLRINESERRATEVTLRVEGRIVGEWGPLVEQHCTELLREVPKLRLDLAGVTYVDRNAVHMLRRLESARVQLDRCPPLVRDLIEQAERP